MAHEHTMSAMRVYSETLPFEDIVKAMPLLRRYVLEVVVAVRPWDEPNLGDFARTLRDGGVSFSLWPMLADEDGRWANVYNARDFAAFTLRLCDLASPRDVLFDLEPPLPRVRRLVKIAGGDGTDKKKLAAERSSFAEASNTLARTFAELRSRNIATSLAVWPLVALDPPFTPAWQRVLGTPVDALPADHVSVMLYTSILEGWSRGTVRRSDARALLARGTERTMHRWPNQGGVSLGCIGVGAFEDEPIYRTPAELAEDVAIAREHGASELALFDLGGILARPPAEAWLEAFTGEYRFTLDPEAIRVRAARSLSRAATWLLAQRRGNTR